VSKIAYIGLWLMFQLDMVKSTLKKMRNLHVCSDLLWHIRSTLSQWLWTHLKMQNLMTPRSARPNRYQPFRNFTSLKIWISETVGRRKFLSVGILSPMHEIKKGILDFWIFTCGLNKAHLKFEEFGQNRHFFGCEARIRGYNLHLWSIKLPCGCQLLP